MEKEDEGPINCGSGNLYGKCGCSWGGSGEQGPEIETVERNFVGRWCPRGPTVSNIRLAGLEYVLHFTALNGKIYFRSYKLLLKKSGCRTPRIELEEMGPSLDLVLRRTHLASDDLYKLSIKMPKALKPKKKKNIS
ncbi:hypothetical protein MJT46_019157 [Ovis ammon polii x Ovis aries]|nr:hypothetical protein MJT46_019157 [Ovis ammon polii x Ovis aries]